jgi:putative nucleotidyltransferase with HDIG domain
VDDVTARAAAFVAGQLTRPAVARLARPAEDLLAHPYVAAAEQVAGDLLSTTGARWRHTQAVAHRAAAVAGVVTPAGRPALVAAAWLHDIGYAQPVQRSTFHPVDGAWFLRRRRWADTVTGLVAHHSGARFVADVRGLGSLMQPFGAEEYLTGPLADALTFADQTTGPGGEEMDVEARLADMLHRHGPDSPNARAHVQRAPAIRAAVQRTQQRLRSSGPAQPVRTLDV